MRVNFFFSRFLITCILTLGILIGFKKSSSFKKNFKNCVFEDNINFTYLNNMYEKYFGSSIPFSDKYFDNSKTVFNETLNYDNVDVYLDGAVLSISDNYLVPSLNDGLVIFVGDKESYGKTVIIEDASGVDVWYSNLENINVGLYEYVTSGDLLGEASGKLYLVFKKDGNILDYQEYLR